MVYKNIEIHNAAKLVDCEDGGTTWLRVPQKVYENLERDQGRQMAKNAVGVELRFVIKGESATIVMQSLNTQHSVSNFHVFRGGIQGGYEDHESDKHVTPDVYEYTIKKSDNIDLLQKISDESSQAWDPEVIRVIFDGGRYKITDVLGDVEPPKKEQTPPKTMLAYGSSITHGSNSLNASYNWVSVVAHRMNMDYRNLGMAGSCCIEPEMAEYIASEGEKGNWDLAIMELGVNVIDWSNDKINERVTKIITEVAGRNKDKQVVVISPFYFNEDYKSGNRAENWRFMIEEIVKKLDFPNVMYINGLDLLGNMSLISADEIHPNIYGVSQIADRLYDKIKGLHI